MDTRNGTLNFGGRQYDRENEGRTSRKVGKDGKEREKRRNGL